MDIIVKSHFDEFKRLYGYENVPESEAFEAFSIYCVASQYIKSETISKDIIENIRIGGGEDWGIDGLLVIINGKVVFDKKIVDDLLAVNGTIAVKIILIQSKISTSIDLGAVCKALNGIEDLARDVLDEGPLPPCNQDLLDYRDLIKYIYSHSSDFKDNHNPQLEGFYVFTGTYNMGDEFESPKNKTLQYLSQTELVESCNYNFVDRKELLKLYKDTKAKVNVKINIEQKLTLPKVEKISDAYLCILPFEELCKLFINNDAIMQEVFYDNVRAFQGMNQVNKSITDSIKAGNIDLFTAMNNGITVIAKKIKPTGHDLELTDYQIVNGCQTCNVLYLNRKMPGIENIRVAVKLIASEDKDIKDKIIIGNNSQTEVKREQLVALLDSQRYIEDYYNAQTKYIKLYYERRSKQYKNDNTKVPYNKIITIPNQILSFVSMFMGAPDKVRGYYGSIVEEFEKNGEKVFAPETNPAFYYTCALASYKMTEMFSGGIIDRRYRKIKFHTLLAFRLMCEKMPLPPFNSNKAQEYCDHLCEILCDDKSCEAGFKAAITLVNTALQRNPKDSDRMNDSFTFKMKELAAQANRINNERKNNTSKAG